MLFKATIPLFSCSVVSNSLRPPWTATCQAFLFFTMSQSLPKLVSNESVMPPNYLILCHPLLLPLFFTSIRVFTNELALCIMRPKYWSFSFIISPSIECSGLISFRTDWFDLLKVQGTLESSPAPQFKASPGWGTTTTIHLPNSFHLTKLRILYPGRKIPWSRKCHSTPVFLAWSQ